MAGAGHGMGLATAKLLLSEGYTAYDGARQAEGADEIERLGGNPLVIEMEDDATMRAAVDQVIEERGRIDVLFNHGCAYPRLQPPSVAITDPTT